MATLDFDLLNREIDSDAPCGPDLEYDPAFVKLSEDIEGTPEQEIGSTFQAAEPPNWKLVRKDLLALLERTHDLRLLVFLTRTAIPLDGWTGFHDCLSVLETQVKTYWDSIHPQLDPDDDNDPTQRVNVLMSLCDFATIMRPITLAPLVESRALGRFSLRDLRFATGREVTPEGTERPDTAQIRAAFADAEPESVDAIGAALNGSLASLDAIEGFVTDQIGVSRAPSFQELRTLLREAKSSFLEFAPDQGEESGAASDGDVGTDGNSSQKRGGSGGTVSLAAINSRQDVIKALDLICDYYAKNEPSSPIPLLLQRSKRLVPMTFMEIMADLAPEGLNQVNTISGQSS